MTFLIWDELIIIESFLISFISLLSIKIFLIPDKMEPDGTSRSKLGLLKGLPCAWALSSRLLPSILAIGSPAYWWVDIKSNGKLFSLTKAKNSLIHLEPEVDGPPTLIKGSTDLIALAVISYKWK